MKKNSKEMLTNCFYSRNVSMYLYKEKQMKVKVFLSAVILGVVIILTACGSIYEKEPVGIGTDYSELKKSPCACLELELAPELPEWFS